ncbi:MAG: PKD domain-containing protein, partial [Patescibacteria group bacterium]
NNARIVYVKSAPGANELAFNQGAYWWRAKVWDNGGADSGFVNGPASFSTVSHSYPSIDFTWNPANPSAAENIRFTDASTTYGGTSKTAWSWNFQDGNPAASNQQNPQTTFITSGAKTVGLQVRDSDNFACTKTKTVNIQLQLPSWKEIKPTQ